LTALGWPAAALAGSALGLLCTYDLLGHPLAFLSFQGAGVLALWFAFRRLEVRPLGARPLLAMAALLRLLLLPLPPSLSDDALRYLWDGRVAWAGANPYLLAPAAQELAPLRDVDWERLPHRQVPTIYPPGAIATFSIATRLPQSLIAWKAMVALADLVGCWFLLELLARRGLPLALAVLYAWNPLVTLETAGMGHLDALGGAAAIAAVALFTRPASTRRVAAAATAAAVGVLMKMVPVFALPMWARQGGRPWRFLLVAVALIAIALLPVLIASGGVPPGLVVYATSWEFNGPVHEPLWRILRALGAEEVVKSTLDAFKQWGGDSRFWNRLYPFAYPQFLARLLLGLGALGAIAWSARERDAVDGTARLFGRLLLLAATCYPWYLLWVLPWAALRRDWAWLLLSASMPLAYLPKAAGVELWPWLFLAIWAPFWLARLTLPAAARSRDGV
jgi:hypothetical protein